MKAKYNQIKKNIAKTSKLDNKHFKLLCEIHAKIFTHKYFEPCSCSPSTIKGWVTDLDNHYKK